MRTPLPSPPAGRCSRSTASGFGYLAFAGLPTRRRRRSGRRPGRAARPKAPHFPARAKRVIFLCMNGGPSHVDMFDYKPEARQRTGEASATGRPRRPSSSAPPSSSASTASPACGSRRCSPRSAKHADDLCVIRSMHTDLPNHSQAFLQMHTGSFQFAGRRSGPGRSTASAPRTPTCPGSSRSTRRPTTAGARNYGQPFLPADYQGTRIGRQPDPGSTPTAGKDEEPGPPANTAEPRPPRDLQRPQLDLVQSLNRHKLERDDHHPEIEGAIESFELAFRMQDEVPKVLDLSGRDARRPVGCTASGGPADRPLRPPVPAGPAAGRGRRAVRRDHCPGGWDHHFSSRRRTAETPPPSTGRSPGCWPT